MQLVAPQEWIDTRFAGAQKKPAAASVRRWLERGDLPGKKIGGRWYVDVAQEENETGNDLADKILRAS